MGQSERFEGLEGVSIENDGPYLYPPESEQRAPSALVEELFSTTFGTRPLRGSVVSLSELCSEQTESIFRGHAESMAKIIARHGSSGLDPNSVLEALVCRAAVEEGPLQVYAGGALTALVQAFYDLGRRDYRFELDLTAFGMRTLELGVLLRGTPEHPLRLSVAGQANFCGVNVEHVSLAAKGKFYHFGYEATQSSFHLAGDAEVFCESVKDCTAELDGTARMAGANSSGTLYLLHPGAAVTFQHPHMAEMAAQYGNITLSHEGCKSSSEA